MKFNKILTGLAVVFCLTAFVLAAQAGPDEYWGLGEVSFGVTNINTIGTVTTTNGPIDIRKFDGRGRLYLLCVTNAGNAVVTANVQSSWNPTNNFTPCLSLSIATNYSASYTNYYGGVSNVVSQTLVLPGVPTWPTAYSSGFNTGPYLTPNPFTNSGAITLNYNAPTVLGINLDDQNQYVKIVWTVSGGTGATNATVGAELFGNSLPLP